MAQPRSSLARLPPLALALAASAACASDLPAASGDLADGSSWEHQVTALVPLATKAASAPSGELGVTIDDGGTTVTGPMYVFKPGGKLDLALSGKGAAAVRFEMFTPAPIGTKTFAAADGYTPVRCYNQPTLTRFERIVLEPAQAVDRLTVHGDPAEIGAEGRTREFRMTKDCLIMPGAELALMPVLHEEPTTAGSFGYTLTVTPSR